MVDIILDIDSVGDDILAVLYAALHKKINVIGITTVNGACGSIEQAVWVALNTVALSGKEIPVYRGAENMLSQNTVYDLGDPIHFDEELRWKFGDRLDKFNTPAQKPEKKEEEKSAVDFLVDSFHERPGEIVLVTTGPVTNIALALRKDPSIAKKVKHAYILGGAFKIPGNITPVTEYNIWADPEAAQLVLRSGMEITLVPLDVCENNEFAAGMMTRDHLAELEYEGTGEIVSYIVNKFPIYIDLWREYFQMGGFPMDDVLTVALAADEDLCEYTSKIFVDVELEGKLSRGQTIACFGRQIMHRKECFAAETRIAKSVDGKRFMNLFVDTILEK